ncbi:UDP-Glycosyltransferase superfamily protein [Fagus crenata]
MDPAKTEPTGVCHVVAMPYPGRGHINPMMNLCKLLVSKSPDILISFVVTEEWLGFIGSDPKPANIRFATVPNVIPSELGRARDFPGFVEAVSTKMEAPFEELLDRLEPRVTAIVADTYLVWIVGLGSRRNIPVASLWTMSATVFSVCHHFELVVQNRHFPVDLSVDKERGDELVDYIPGVSTTRVADLPMTNTRGDSRKVLSRALECISLVSKAQYLLFTSVHELEAQVIDTLKAKLHIPVYPIGSAIPYLEFEKTSSITNANNVVNYFQWLDSQPPSSVLYISLGSFLSISNAQMDEIVGGIRDSGVRYLWISRGENDQFKDGCGDMGLVVPWCDQLKSSFIKEAFAPLSLSLVSIKFKEMDPAKTEPTAVCHVVAMPYPGRGHINPMMNLCKLLVSKSPDILISFVVTEEWLSFIGSDPKPANIRFATVPNVIPSELGRAKALAGFVEAVSTKMEAPFEELLDRLEPPVTAIVADTCLVWIVGLGSRRNIPVASLWTMSATVFSVFHHFELVVQNRHFPVDLSGA